MSQQNLEKEAGCGQTDCRKMKQQAMAKWTADKEAGNGQATDCRKTSSRFCCPGAHTTLWSSPLATLHSCEATSCSPRDDHASPACFPGAKCVAHTHCYGAP